MSRPRERVALIGGGPPRPLTALRLARQHHVQPGAHPGFADREHFGRRELPLSPEQIHAEVVAQVGALLGLAQAAGQISVNAQESPGRSALA